MGDYIIFFIPDPQKAGGQNFKCLMLLYPASRHVGFTALQHTHTHAHTHTHTHTLQYTPPRSDGFTAHRHGLVQRWHWSRDEIWHLSRPGFGPGVSEIWRMHAGSGPDQGRIRSRSYSSCISLHRPLYSSSCIFIALIE